MVEFATQFERTQPGSRPALQAINGRGTSSNDPNGYTALGNLFATPAFLAKPTDTRKHPEVRAALRYRAFERYGRRPADEPEQVKPDGYGDLSGRRSPLLLPELRVALRARRA